MFCSNCGKPLESEAFCPFCGTKQPESAPATTTEPAAESVAETPAPAAPVTAPEPIAEAPAPAAPVAAPEPVAETPAPVTPVVTPEPAAETPAPAAPVAAEPVAETSAAAAEAKPKKKKSAKPVIIIGAIVLGIALLAGAGFGVSYFLTSSKYDKGMEAINDEDYKTALSTFTELKDFKDSEYWAEYAQLEIEYEKLDSLDEAGDYDGIIEMLNTRSKFFGNDDKGKEAKALLDEYTTLKAAFEDKDAENYFEAADKFDSLTLFGDKYDYEKDMCRIYGYIEEQDWISAIGYLYGIQIQDLDLAYIDKPLGSEQSLISKEYIANNNYVSDPQAFDDALDLASVEEKALAETAVNGLWYNYAYNKWMNYEYEEAIQILEKIGDFKDAPYVLTRVQTDLDNCTNTYNKAMEYYENGEYYKAMKQFETITYFKDSEEMAKACPQELPETGDCMVNDGSIELEIYAPSGIKSLIIRFYDSDGDVCAQVFLRPDESVTLYVAADTYTIKVGYGTEWYGETDLFGESGRYTQLNNGDDPEFTFQYGYWYQLELMSVAGGNVGQDTLPGADAM